MTQSGWSLVKANELHLMKGTFPGLRVEFLVGTRVANRPKFSLVLVPFFSAPSKNLLVLVPFFSALALSIISARFQCSSTKIQCLSAFSALTIFCHKNMASSNVKLLSLIIGVTNKSLKPILSEIQQVYKGFRLIEISIFCNFMHISVFQNENSAKNCHQALKALKSSALKKNKALVLFLSARH